MSEMMKAGGVECVRLLIVLTHSIVINDWEESLVSI